MDIKVGDKLYDSLKLADGSFATRERVITKVLKSRVRCEDDTEWRIPQGYRREFTSTKPYSKMVVYDKPRWEDQRIFTAAEVEEYNANVAKNKKREADNARDELIARHTRDGSFSAENFFREARKDGNRIYSWDTKVVLSRAVELGVLQEKDLVDKLIELYCDAVNEVRDLRQRMKSEGESLVRYAEGQTRSSFVKST